MTPGLKYVSDLHRPHEERDPDVLPRTSNATFEQLKDVYKRGYSTRWTRGLICEGHLQDATLLTHSIDDGKLTLQVRRERIVLNSGRLSCFCRQGDEGTWILDTGIKVVGLLWGGHSGGWTFYTDVHDLFEHIKEVTGAVDVRLPKPPVPWDWKTGCIDKPSAVTTNGQ